MSFACPKRPHADPTIRKMRVRLVRHRTPGVHSHVRTHLRLRVCAARGLSDVVIKENRRLSERTLGAHRRIRMFEQTKRCQWHAFDWKVRREFFGAGTYHVAARVWDEDGQSSKTVSRKITTIH